MALWLLVVAGRAGRPGRGADPRRAGLARRCRRGGRRDGVLLGAGGAHRWPTGGLRRAGAGAGRAVLAARPGLPAHRCRGDDLRGLGGARGDGHDARRCSSCARPASAWSPCSSPASARWPRSASTRWSRWCASSTSPWAWRWSARSASSTGSAPVCTASAAVGWWWSPSVACCSRSRCCTPRCCAATARQELVDHLLDGVRWSRDHLGAFPRPIETVLGVPGAGLGLPHARPAPAGLVAVRLRRRGDRPGRQLAGEPGDLPGRVRPVGGLRPRRRPASSATS